MRPELETNREWWDGVVDVHARSAFYDVEGFRAGRLTLQPTEIDEVGDVSGKRLAHLQCHFGLDTLSWARLGAHVTGVDFAPKAVALASELAGELGLQARFVCADVLALDLGETFDIVYTGGGALNWLPDLEAWAAVVLRHLAPDGFLYLREFHPTGWIFDYDAAEPVVRYDYFQGREPFIDDNPGTYADPDAVLACNRNCEWAHPIGEVVSALAGAGLRIEFLRESDRCGFKWLPFMERDDRGWYVPGLALPWMYSLRASR